MSSGDSPQSIVWVILFFLNSKNHAVHISVPPVQCGIVLSLLIQGIIFNSLDEPYYFQVSISNSIHRLNSTCISSISCHPLLLAKWVGRVLVIPSPGINNNSIRSLNYSSKFKQSSRRSYPISYYYFLNIRSTNDLLWHIKHIFRITRIFRRKAIENLTLVLLREINAAPPSIHAGGLECSSLFQ